MFDLVFLRHYRFIPCFVGWHTPESGFHNFVISKPPLAKVVEFAGGPRGGWNAYHCRLSH